MTLKDASHPSLFNFGHLITAKCRHAGLCIYQFHCYSGSKGHKAIRHLYLCRFAYIMQAVLGYLEFWLLNFHAISYYTLAIKYNLSFKQVCNAHLLKHNKFYYQLNVTINCAICNDLKWYFIVILHCT